MKQLYKLLISLSIPLLALLILISILFKEYHDEYFNDFYDNWNKEPIVNISVVGENEKNIETLAKLNGKNLMKWKGKYFKITRAKRNYFELYSNNKLNRKKCGVDSYGNILYFHDFEECPINFIEFSHNEKPFYANFSYTTAKFDDSTYIHFSNNFTEGKILIDLSVSDCMPSIKRRLNKDLFNKGLCLDSLSYMKLDVESFYVFQKQNEIGNDITDSQKYTDYVYLYGRTYIPNNKLNKFYQRTDIKFIKTLRHFSLGKNIFSLIAIINIIIYIYFDFRFSKKKLPIGNYYILSWGVLSIISVLIIIILNIINNSYYNKFKNDYLKYIIHEIRQYYSEKHYFIYCNDAIIYISFFIFIYLIIFLFSLENKEENQYGLNYFFKYYSDKNSYKEIPDDDDEGIIHLCRSELCCSCLEKKKKKIKTDELSDFMIEIGEKMQNLKEEFKDIHNQLKSLKIYDVVKSFKYANEKIPDLDYDGAVREFKENIEKK